MLLLIPGCFIFTAHTSADIVLAFTNPASRYQYGLHGNGPGDTSGLLTDPATGQSGRILTRAITPAGGTVYIEANSLLGINAPGSDGDNLFEPAESWTFSWDQQVALTRLEMLYVSFLNHNGPLLFKLQSDAWIGKPWVSGPGDTNNTNFQFDGQSGTFLLERPASGTNTYVTFSPGELFGGAVLTLPADTAVSFSNSGASYAAVRSMSFSIVPEPSVMALVVSGLILLRTATSRARNAPRRGC